MKKYSSLSIIVLIIALIVLPSCKSKVDHQKKSIAMVFPVTVDAFEQFRIEFEKIAKVKGIEVYWFSAEGDPNRFNSSIKAALLKKPSLLVTVGTQVTNTAFGPDFAKDLPIVVASAISDPSKVESLVNLGIDPPRKRPVAIISDSPKDDIYALSAKVIGSFIKGQRKFGILYNTAEINSQNTALSLAKALENDGMKFIPGIISGKDDVDKVTKSLLLKGVDLLVIPHDKYAIGKARVIVKLGLESGTKPVPVFSLDDGTVRKDGAAVGVSVSYGLLGKMSGELCLKILAGDDATMIPVQRQEHAAVYLNRDALAKYSISLPEEFLKNAIIY